MDDYPSNSREPKPVKKGEDAPPRRVEKPVVTGEVLRRKPALGKRIKNAFFGGDAQSAGQYVMIEVVLPAIKDTIADAVSQAVERMIFGEGRSTSRRTGQRPGYQGWTNYNRIGNQQPSQSRRDERRELSRSARAAHSFDDVIIPTRTEAKEVLDQMFHILQKYEVVTVGDLYELVNIQPSYVDENWGWDDLRGAGITRVNNGYLLDLPRPDAIK
jgi:hypothetical protein